MWASNVCQDSLSISNAYTAMTPVLQALFSELEVFGEQNDRINNERPKRMLNITRDTGEFLGILVKASKAKNILEIGTSNGYSTLWLADAALHTKGHVTTVEYADYKIALAAKNFERSGLARQITQKHGDAGALLAGLTAASVDLLFLDSERSEYVGWWPNIKRAIQPGGLLVVDNAISHAVEMAPFIELVRQDHDFTTSLVPVGNGEFLAVRSDNNA
jgi:predicted O-methyltransferase YrrM